MKRHYNQYICSSSSSSSTALCVITMCNDHSQYVNHWALLYTYSVLLICIALTLTKACFDSGILHRTYSQPYTCWHFCQWNYNYPAAVHMWTKLYMLTGNVFSIAVLKRALRETQTLRAGCSKAEPKKIRPTQTPFPGAQDGQNLISWRWSLPSPTDPVCWRSVHAISNYRGNRPTNTHNQTTDSYKE